MRYVLVMLGSLVGLVIVAWLLLWRRLGLAVPDVSANKDVRTKNPPSLDNSLLATLVHGENFLLKRHVDIPSTP